MRRKHASLLLAGFVLSGILFACPVSAELSSEFWQKNDAFVQAYEQKDAERLLELGNQIVAELAQQEQTESTITMTATKLLQMAETCELQGNFSASADCFSRYLPYAETLGWADGVKIAKAKIEQFTPRAELYQQTTVPQSYHGAKYEPESGIYYGIPSDSALYESLSGASMTLVYLEYGDRNWDWLRVTFNRAAQRGQLVEFALNVPGEGTQIKEINQQDEYLVSLLDFIGSHSNVKILLRFGAEMDIWGDPATPEDFIAAFRHVATLAREHAPNVAMLWSPNSTSSWNINMDDYYPGDEYVDWVGCSLYSQKYFLGRNDWPDAEKFNEIVFRSGQNADPVLALSRLVETYGNRKPIALSESGVSHYIRTLGEDCTDWALSHLKQMYYNIPLVYPQVKLIAYFDRTMENETNEYALGKNPQLSQLYQELTSTLPHFIQCGQEKASAYKPLGGMLLQNSEPLYAYIHSYGNLAPAATLALDGTAVASANGLPHRFAADLSAYQQGEHTLSVTADGYTKDFPVLLQQEITLTLNGERLECEVPPVILHDRTMVPVRIISEKLGANVQWEPSARIISITKDGIALSMQIDNPAMQKNGQEVVLEAPPQILNDRTMVPIRAIAEAFGLDVDWDAGSRTVTLQTGA